MRIAYVCTDPGVPVFGRKGASVHAQSVLRTLVARGDEVHLLTVRTGGDPPADLRRVRLHAVPRASAADPPTREVSAQQADARVGGLLSHLHAQRRLDLVYERYSLWGRTAMAWAAEHDVASALEVNAPLVEEQAAHRVLVDRLRAEQIAVQVMSTAGAVLCVSEAVAAWARQHTADTRNVHTLPNGVDTIRVHPSSRPLTPPTGTPFTVGFVGTLKPWHGVDTLADAFAQLASVDPTYRLLIVGDGPLAGSLRTQLEQAGVSAQVEMTGALEPHAVPAMLHRMDIATAPYPQLDDFYFSPLKVYEYLAAGVPIVASRVGDLPNLLDHGELGVLVEAGDPIALATALATLRANPEHRAQLSRDGRHRAVERHDWSQIVRVALSLAQVHPKVSHVEVVRRAG
ncbi:MAG: glycosyltransferase family 4 protein, partial [Pseudonocardiaceae bacterium]